MKAICTVALLYGAVFAGVQAIALSDPIYRSGSIPSTPLAWPGVIITATSDAMHDALKGVQR